MTVTTTTARFSYVGDGNAGPDTATGIKVLASTDVKVYWNKASSGSGTPVTVGDTSTAMSTSGYLTLNTHYTVQNAGTNNDITITLVASGWTISRSLAYATSSDTLVVTREVPYTQPSNYQNNDTFDAETLEQSLDRSTMQIQQLTDVADRNFVFSSTLSDSDFNSAPLSGTDFSTVRERASTVITGKTARANKVLGFDANGDVSTTQEIGSFLGNWAASTAYVARDIVKDSSNSNIFICNTSHTSTGSTPVSTNTDAAKWTLVLDVATASGGVIEAANWARKVDGIVDASTGSDDFSSKAYAIGGTGVTTSSGKGAAKEWATTTGGAVDTSEYSAKEYAIGDVTASGGSAKAWAIDGSSPDGTSEKSAKTLAGEAGTSATASATSATASATSATASATSATTSATSATASATSATASETAKTASELALDTFDDRFLGAKNSAPTEDNDGNAIIEGALYWHSTSKKLYVWNDTSNTWITLTAAADANSITGANTITSSDGNDLTLATDADGENVIINDSTGSNYFKLPNERGENNYVLTRDNTAGTGGTVWKETANAPTLTSLDYPGDDTALDPAGEFNLASSSTIDADATVTVSSTTNLKQGMLVTGDGIPTSTTVLSITNATTFELSANATETGTVTLTFNTQTLVITGADFSADAGITVTIDGDSVSTITRDSSTQLTVTGMPAKTAGTYANGLVVTNPSGLAGNIDVDYSALPAWTSHASGNLSSSLEDTEISTIELVATDATSYAITSGGLPTGLSLATTGINAGDITGTLDADPATYNFTVTATDAQAQSSPRLFNIIVYSLPTGGAIDDYDEGGTTYRFHTFYTGGNDSPTNIFTVFSSLNVDYLVVAGGGGGGTSRGSGGGGGGMRVGTEFAVSVAGGPYTIVVGAGGAGGPYSAGGRQGLDGGPSSFATNSTLGGGGGAGDADADGRDGGSGGGCEGSGSPGTGEEGEGNDGGTGSGSAPSYGAGGGGGKGGVGQPGYSTIGGIGGLGANSSITGATVGYAGGGGGGALGAGTGGTVNATIAGGAGAGGNGDSHVGTIYGGTGTPNRGGGGGGGGGSTTEKTGGDGGSGIVVIRYAV